jgi:hypothetical protein
LEPKEGENAPPPAEVAKPSSPLLEVKDEVLEEAPSAQEKPEEERVDMRAAEESPQLLSRSPAGTKGSFLVLLLMELGGPGLGLLDNARVMRMSPEMLGQ